MNHVCYAVLSECFSFVSCLSYVSLEMSCVRFYPNVLRSFCACHTFLSECLAFGSRLLFAACAPNRTACGRVAFLFRRGSGSPFVRSRMSRGHRALLVHFGLARFLAAIPTGKRRDAGNGVGGEAECVFAQAYRLCGVFRGEYAGAKGGSRTAAAPQTAPKSHWLSGLSSFGS